MKKKIILTTLLGFLVILINPQPTSAAQIYLTPASGRLSVGDEFIVEVLADTQGQTVNTAETNITFSSATLELLDVNQGSTFLLPTPASQHVEGNTVYLGGGLPSPGFNGKTGVIGTLKFRARSVGAANITLTRGRILLNDGSGSTTNVALAHAQFQITLAPVGEVKVFSRTHADQRGWSNYNDVDLGWVLPQGATSVSYVWDQSPGTIPDDSIEPAEGQAASYPGVRDGIWYFHIKAKGSRANDPFGGTAHYKVSIDTVPPVPFNIGLVSEDDVNDASITPTIMYKAADSLSGVHRYDVYIDNKLSKELAAPQFSFPKQGTGPHMIKVIAYDKAGNGTESILPVTITSPLSQPVTVDYVRKFLQLPVYVLILINLLMFGLVGIVIRNQRKQAAHSQVQNVQMQSLQSEISRVVEIDLDLSKLRRQIDVRFMDMAVSRDKQMQNLRMEIDHKLAMEIDKNVAWMKAEITNRIRETSVNNPKMALKIQKIVADNIAAEIEANSKKLKQIADDNTAKLGPQYRQVGYGMYAMHDSTQEVMKRVEILEKLQKELRGY